MSHRVDDGQRELLRQAARWHALLCSEDASPADRATWQAWHDASADHQWAWRQVESLRRRLQGAHGPLGAQALKMADKRIGGSRRAALKAIGLAVATGGVLALGRRTDTWQQWAADYRTGVGEQREVLLADGSRVYLNTDTSLDVRYGDHARLLYLHHGEILVETAPDQLARPFQVEVEDGTVQALGTRFIVRQDGARGAFVMVLASAVAVQPRNAAHAPPVRVNAGQQAWFHADGVEPVQPAEDSRAAWRTGMLVVDGWRMEDVLAELGRYRSGWLGCDTGIAGLRVTGAFPVLDTDKALDALAESFPISVRRRTRYWVQLVAKGG